jgi:hypothetical protein
LPPSGLTPGESQWHASDNAKRFRASPHPLLGPKDVAYRFNSLGYRCPEFSVPSSAPARKPALTLLTLGASEVMGTGLPEEKVFGAVLARQLESHCGGPVMHWNLGKGGASTDYISRVLFSALHVLKPDIVVLNFPHASRREHFDDTGRVFDFHPVQRKSKSALERLKLKIAADPLRAEVMRAQATLGGAFSDTVNRYKNYQVCASLCEAARVMWVFAGMQEKYLDAVSELVDGAHWVRPGLGDLRVASTAEDGMRWARDMAHPGIAPNRDFAALVFEKLQALYPDRLCAQTQTHTPARAHVG